MAWGAKRFDMNSFITQSKGLDCGGSLVYFGSKRRCKRLVLLKRLQLNAGSGHMNEDMVRLLREMYKAMSQGEVKNINFANYKSKYE